MKKFFFIIFALFFFIPAITDAADFKLTPSTGTYGSNTTFTVDIKINTFGESINAAQGKLTFDTTVLQVQNISKDGSIFNFWLQEPSFSNSEGSVEFIGGTPSGTSGSSLQVLSVTFETQSVGSSDVIFVNGSITASDGSGTNIFGNAQGATFAVASGAGGSTSSSTDSPEPVLGPVPDPVQITRTPTQATGLPATPVLGVTLYPDPAHWYSLISNFAVAWDLPSDISDVATAFNTNPNYDIPEESEGLFESKTFKAVQDDGVYYVHVRFKNNVGWGDTAHYRVAIDSEPPLAFEIDIPSGSSSDNPTPTLVFNTGDALSGLLSYLIQINDTEPFSVDATEEIEETVPSVTILETGGGFLNVRAQPDLSSDIITRVTPGDTYAFTDQQDQWYQIVFEDESDGWVFEQYVQEVSAFQAVGSVTQYTLEPHPPGEYYINVIAQDRAGNSVEARTKVEIVPIESPVVTSITETVTRGTDDILKVKGTALPHATVIVTIEDEAQFLVVETSVDTDQSGQWVYELDRELRRGSYLARVQTRDERGALSLLTEPLEIKVKDKPIITIGSLAITLRTILYILILGIIVTAIILWRKTVMRHIKMSMEAIIINRDLKNAFDQIGNELSIIHTEITSEKKRATQKNVVYERGIEKIKTVLLKVQKYISKDIENLQNR